MKEIFLKIKKKLVVMNKTFKSDCNFSMYYAILRIISNIATQLQLKKIFGIVDKRRNKWILSYLNKCFESLINEYKNCNEIGVINENPAIWICWWTGEETAPDLVKRCIDSIRKCAGTHPVKFIDKNTYSLYIDIPDYMIKKVKEGNMGLAHLADYIRVSLLGKYGGLWLDATIFCAKELPEDYFKLPFFTCKSNPTECGYISQMRWTTFVLGGWKGNLFFSFMKEAFESYWSKEKVAIDYLFFDYLIELVCCKIPFISKQLENVPVNNLYRDELQAAMNKNLPGKCWNDVLKEENVLYKLSWRERYKIKTDNGEDSIYKFFLNY